MLKNSKNQCKNLLSLKHVMPLKQQKSLFDRQMGYYQRHLWPYNPVHTCRLYGIVSVCARFYM